MTDFEAIDRALDAVFLEAGPRLQDSLSARVGLDIDPLLPALQTLAIAAIDVAAGVAVSLDFGTEQIYMDFLTGPLAERIVERILPEQGLATVQRLYGAEFATLRDKFEFGHEFAEDGAEKLFVVPKSLNEDDSEERREPAPPAVHALYARHGEWEKWSTRGVRYVLRIHLARARNEIAETVKGRTSYWAARWTLGRAAAAGNVARVSPTLEAAATPAPSAHNLQTVAGIQSALIEYRERYPTSSDAAIARAAKVDPADISKWKKLNLPDGVKKARIEDAVLNYMPPSPKVRTASRD